jgi:hypothetical protein
MRSSDDATVVGNEGNIVMVREDIEDEAFDDCRVLQPDGCGLNLCVEPPYGRMYSESLLIRQ